MMRSSAVATSAVLLLSVAAFELAAAPNFVLQQALDAPVIGEAQGKAGSSPINHGFEGGLYLKSGGQYHLFPSECMMDQPEVPWDIHMMSHHWTSPNGLNWTKGAMVVNSSAKMDGSDRRGAIWAPMPIYNPSEERWNLFYVGYTCDPGQVDGAIYRLVSSTPGEAGIGGPYPVSAVLPLVLLLLLLLMQLVVVALVLVLVLVVAAVLLLVVLLLVVLLPLLCRPCRPYRSC